MAGMLRRLRAHLPARHRAILRNVWGRVLVAVPDRPFLGARRRYERRLLAAPSAEPPALLRLAAFRRRIPSSVEAFGLMGRPELRMANIESIGTQVIFWTGSHWVAKHAAGLEVWEELCRRAGRVVELGANVGYYTIAGGLAAHGPYAAYEPHPRSCAALRANLELNAVSGVEVIEAAVVPGPAPATVELLCTTGTDHAAPSGAMVKGSSMATDELLSDVETVVVAAVPFTVAIDMADLVKIDVEGLEPLLLSSAWEHLRASKPVLMIEILEGNADLRALIPRLLVDLDAAVYAMRRDHLVPIAVGLVQDGPLAEVSRTWDFLVVPSERAAFVKGLVSDVGR
jgi:FkbM family methyltransferase